MPTPSSPPCVPPPPSSPVRPAAPAGTALVRLAPGLRVVTRGRDRLQVGLYAGRRVVLPRTPVVERTLLDLLDRVAPAGDPDTQAVLDVLEDGGCLLPQRRPHPPRVAVLHGGRRPGEDRPGRPLLEDLLRAGGARPTDGSVPLGTDPAPDAAVVVGWSEPDRDLLDPLLRAGVPHVLVRLVDGGVVLGPFVVPGTTACLRCLDAHRSVHDPDHVAVTARYVRAGGPHEAAAPAHLHHLALGWVVRDVLAHLGGARPSTWSRTWHLGPDGGAPVVEEWDRHPGCGCSWAADARPSGTMEP